MVFEGKNKQIHLVTTNRCFFNCKHCCGAKNTSELPVDTILSLIEYAKKNCADMDWGGGEILVRGKSFLKTITEEFDKKTINTLYSTLHIPLDDEWIELLNRFNRLMFSLDSYRLSIQNYDISLVLKNVKRLSIEQKIASYTPCLQDSQKEYKKYYLLASDAGAKIFHIGFLYPSQHYGLLSAKKYIETIEAFCNLQAKHGGPEVGFFAVDSFKPNEAFGWRAFDCFRKGLYVSADGLVSSCAADTFAPQKINVPVTTVREFFNNPEQLFEQNRKFVEENFFKVSKKCLNCNYYSFCLGGCPYFRSFSENGVDIYCEVYKFIFSLKNSFREVF